MHEEFDDFLVSSLLNVKYTSNMATWFVCSVQWRQYTSCNVPGDESNKLRQYHS